MKTFDCEALTETGKPTKFTLEAASHEEAIIGARAKGLFPTSVKERKTKGAEEKSEEIIISNKKEEWVNIKINKKHVFYFLFFILGNATGFQIAILIYFLFS